MRSVIFTMRFRAGAVKDILNRAGMKFTDIIEDERKVPDTIVIVFDRNSEMWKGTHLKGLRRR